MIVLLKSHPALTDEPTPDQAKAGNYKKPRIQWNGLEIAIENPAGSIRRGHDRAGKPWEIRLKFDYGYICRSEGVDGDEIDVLLGPDLSAPFVYVVHQRKYGDWSAYDEDKCLIGFDSEESAKAAFLSNYNDPRFLGPITIMPVDEFIAKVKATREKPQMIKSVVLFFKSHVRGHYRTINGKPVYVAPYENKKTRKVKLIAKPKGKDRVTEDMFDSRFSGDLYDPSAVKELRKPNDRKGVVKRDLTDDNQPRTLDMFEEAEKMTTQEPLNVVAKGKQSRGKWHYTVTLPDGSVSEFKSDTRYTHAGVVKTGPEARNPGVVKVIQYLESPDDIEAWKEKALKSKAHIQAVAVPIELQEAKPARAKKTAEKTVNAPPFDRSRIPSGSTWGEHTLEVSSVGRKWIKVKVPGKRYEMQAELNEVSAGWKEGDTVTFYGAKHVESDRYGTKTTYYPAPREIKSAIDEEKAIPEIKRWLGYVEEKAPQGYVYQNGVDKLRSLGIGKHPELNERLNAAIAKAKEVRAAQEKKWAEEKAQRTKQYAEERSAKAATRQQRHLFPLSNAPRINVPIRKYGKVIVYTGSGKQFRIGEDDPSVHGSHLLGHEGAYGAYFYYRDATPEEVSQLESREREQAAEREKENHKKAVISEAREYIKTHGERPEGMHIPEGEKLHDTQNIYGGGDWFVIGPEWIWYVQNNGGDGDNWAINNVRTGGAGAIGWRVPFDQALADRLRHVEEPLSKAILFFKRQ